MFIIKSIGKAFILMIAVLLSSNSQAAFYGTVQVNDRIDSCTKVRNWTENYYENGGGTHSPLAVSYCNNGAYTIKTTKLEIWRKDGTGDGWWNYIYSNKVKGNISVGKGVSFEGLVLEKGEDYKVKLTYNISSGDVKSCTKKFTSDDGMLWQVLSTGTTRNNNRCRTIQYRD